MKEYHKIQSIFKRDHRGKFIIGEYACDEIDYLRNNVWDWTEKIDGTNVRVGLDSEGRFRVGGKTEDAQISIRLLEAIQELISEDKFRAVFKGVEKNVCVYGEGFGVKINKGSKYLPDSNSFALFDVRVVDWWLRRADVLDVADKLSVKPVSLVSRGTLDEAIEFVKSGKNLSEYGDFEAEGLVLRPAVPLFSRNGSRIITKIKAKDFR